MLSAKVKESVKAEINVGTELVGAGIITTGLVTAGIGMWVVAGFISGMMEAGGLIQFVGSWVTAVIG